MEGAAPAAPGFREGPASRGGPAGFTVFDEISQGPVRRGEADPSGKMLTKACWIVGLLPCVLAGCATLEEPADSTSAAIPERRSGVEVGSLSGDTGHPVPITERNDGSSVSGNAEGAKAPAWSPPEPKPEKDDWIRLKSGEWLRGEIKSLRRDDLEFDSEELDDLELDWDDVVEVRTSRRYTVVFQDRTTTTGTLLIRDGMLTVYGDTEQRYARDRILSIVPGEARELNYWTGKISVGLSLRSGNTDQSEFTALAFLRRRGPHSRFDLQYNGTIGTLDGTENVHNHRLAGKWDVFLTRHFFVTPLFMEYFRDRFQNIDVRLTPGAGLGYVLIDTKDFDWEVEGGGAYQYTRFDSVGVGEDRVEEEGAARFATSASIDITDDVEFRLDYALTFGVPETQDAYHHALALLSVEIFNDLDLDISFIWDRVETPRPDEDGNRPDRDDFRLTVGLGFEF